jgi:hypothetical protein
MCTLYAVSPQVRPVIISGSRRFVEAAIEAAKPRYQELRERGVSGECPALLKTA